MATRKKSDAPSYKELVRRLKTEGPGSLYVLYGAEDYLVRSFARQLRDACVSAGTEDFDAKRLEGPGLNADDLAGALEAIPFFGGRTFVELHGVDINQCTGERFQQLLGDIPEWCTVVVTLPEGVKPDGRLSLTKLLREKGCVVEFAAQPESLLFDWLEKRFAAHGKTIRRPAMERLLFLSGTLMTRLIPEIDKICAYTVGGEVTATDVDAVAHHIPEASVFEMTDCIAEGNTDRAAGLMAELMASGEEPLMLTAVIGNQIRQLYAAKVAQERGLGTEFVQEVTRDKNGKKKPDFAVRNLMNSARRFGLEELRRDVRLCTETDYLLKSDNTTTGTERMAELLLRLAMNGDHAAH